jgi:hypothetical protein
MERVPDVGFILNAMISEGLIKQPGDIENDHIAFRTLGVPHLGIKSFEKIFLHYGYQKRQHYYFRQKKLDAWWYAPPEDNYPRIFVSELKVDQLSKDARDIIQYYTSGITSDPVDALDLNDAPSVDQFLHSPLWRTPSLEHYELLAGESEYAAWVIYNRYYLNHFTVSVHNLQEGYNTVALFNKFLEANQFILNDAGGKIKISPDQGLLQSSTVARMMEATFAGGEKIFIPGSYVEFAERKVLPRFSNLLPHQIKREHRRDGFEAGNADKTFESTYAEQTQRL